MSWQPPSDEQRREQALRMREEAHQRVLDTIGRLRVVGYVVGALGIAFIVILPVLVLLFAPVEVRGMAAAFVAVGLGLIAFGVWSNSIYRPLPRELLANGVATEAVILESGMVGPQVQTTGFGVSGTLMRRRYRLEVRPSNGSAYEVELRTFDGPMLMGIGNPPVTVYVDPNDRTRLCPDWSTLPRGA